MEYSNVIAVTNRHLAGADFLEKVEKTAALGVKAIILREKDLSEEEYEKHAVQVKSICDQTGVMCILHTYVDVARRLDVSNIHLPLPLLLEYYAKQQKEPHKKILSDFQIVGASVHSVQQAQEAQRAGASYITAGHIFTTDCKKGLPPRGLLFMEEVCGVVRIPVYGIGGIHEDNYQQVLSHGAQSVCMMSEFMKEMD